MVTIEGLQKGMRTVLQEREVDTSGLNAEKLREILHQYEVWIQVNAHVTCIIKLSLLCRILRNRPPFSKKPLRNEGMSASISLNFTMS